MKPQTLIRWHALIDSKDLAALDDLLADNAVFQSPVVHTPQVGKQITGMYLRAAAMVLMSAGTFRYLNEWYNDSSAVLEFEAEVNGITINGVDMIFWNADGKIDRFKVMVRPLKAVNMIHEMMGMMLKGGKA